MTPIQLEKAIAQVFNDKIKCDAFYNHNSPTVSLRLFFSKELSVFPHRNSLDKMYEIFNEFKEAVVPEYDKLVEENKKLRMIVDALGIKDVVEKEKLQLDWNAKLYLGELWLNDTKRIICIK